MSKFSLNFNSGSPIAKVIGGDLAGETLYIDTEDHKKGYKRLSLPKGLRMPPRKEAELMMFLQDAYHKGIPPEHLQAAPAMKELYAKMVSSADSTSRVDLPPNSSFSLIPTKDKKTREVWYVSGPSGSGKSYIAKGLAAEYRAYFPDRPVFLISKLTEDSTLDKLKFIERIDTAKLVEDPITDLKMFDDSMIIFDDIENFDKETDKVIQNLANSIASTGRHNNITMVYITHLLSDYKRTRLLLMEATHYVLYPLSTGIHAFNYMCKTYLGLDKNQITEVRKAASRWVMLKKGYPSYLITEHMAKIMNQE
jgi:predicted AAA+ superfamily ATPase